MTFRPGERIVGIMLSYANIANTDGTFGAPGTIYPNSESVYVNFQRGRMGRRHGHGPDSDHHARTGRLHLIGSGLGLLGLIKRRTLFRRSL